MFDYNFTGFVFELQPETEHERRRSEERQKESERKWDEKIHWNYGYDLPINKHQFAFPLNRSLWLQLRKF